MNADNDDLSIHVSPYFLSDLNETVSRYDRIVASASTESLEMMWIGWGLIATGVAIFSIAVFSAILLTPNVRKSPFNAYIIYLIVPDIIFSLFCAMACFINLSVGHIASTALCRFQSFFMVFGIGANSWLNLVVSMEVHKMLRQSQHCQRYDPPSRRTVTMQALTVYFLVTLFACLEYIPGGVPPIQSGPQNGAVCLPVEYSDASAWFYYLFLLPCLALIPLIGVVGIALHVWYNRMLPTIGSTRNLVLYFGRVFVCFAVMWLPGVLLFFVSVGKTSQWVQWSGGAWSHLQGAVSAGLALLKPDIGAAFRDLIHGRLTMGRLDDWTIAVLPSSIVKRLSLSLSTLQSTSASALPASIDSNGCIQAEQALSMDQPVTQLERIVNTPSFGADASNMKASGCDAAVDIVSIADQKATEGTRDGEDMV